MLVCANEYRKRHVAAAATALRERAAAATGVFRGLTLRLYAAVARLCRRLPVPTVQRQWLYAVILIGADQITALFNSEKDPVMQQVASTGARLYFAAVLFAGANLLFSVFFTSTEYPRPAFVISIMRGIAVIAPLIYLFSTLFEMTGVFMAFPATELITALAGFVFYRLRRKQLISQLPDTLPA